MKKLLKVNTVLFGNRLIILRKKIKTILLKTLMS